MSNQGRGRKDAQGSVERENAPSHPHAHVWLRDLCKGTRSNANQVGPRVSSVCSSGIVKARRHIGSYAWRQRISSRVRTWCFSKDKTHLEDFPSGSNDEPSTVKIDISSKSGVDKLEVNVGVNFVAERPQGREVQMSISHEKRCERRGGSLQGKVGSKGVVASGRC